MPGDANERNGVSVHIQLSHDAWGRLVMVDGNGREHVGVEPVRGFPVTDPRRGVALIDAEGRELLWIEDLDHLAAEPRAVLERALADREFLPVLKKIVKVSAMAEPATWEVETDRGPTRFVLNSAEEVRRLSGGRALITDADGLRYLITELSAMDVGSRRILDRYL